MSERKVVPSKPPEVGRVESIESYELVEPRFKAGPDILPTSKTDVDVVVLRKQPAVATRHAAHIESYRILPHFRKPLGRRDVALEGYSQRESHIHSGEFRRGPVGPISGHQSCARVALVPGPDGKVRRVPLHIAYGRLLTHADAGLDRLLYQECV